MCGVYFSSVNAKTGRIKNTTKKLQTIGKMVCSSAFGTPGWARTSGLSLRRRPLYPTELRGLMQKIFNYPAQQDSSELPLRRRPLYPSELLGHVSLPVYSTEKTGGCQVGNADGLTGRNLGGLACGEAGGICDSGSVQAEYKRNWGALRQYRHWKRKIKAVLTADLQKSGGQRILFG